MNPNHLLWKPTGCSALLTLSHSLVETHSIVPNTSAIRDLDTRTTRLETKLNETSITLQKIEHKLDGLGESFTDKIDRLQKEIGVRTSAERTVTWKPFLWLLGVMAFCILGGTGLLYFQFLPDKIEAGISNSKSLSDKFGSLNGAITNLTNEVKGIKDSKFISVALKDAVSGDESALAKRLPEVQKLTRQLIAQKVLLESKDYKEISEPLASHYKSSKSPLKHQIWVALIGLANARSSTDATIHPLSDADIASAQAAGTYFKDTDVDLSDKTNWENAIFVNCKISISKPEMNLVLTRVRFLECDFQLVENWSNQKLLEAILENDGSEINSTVAWFSVLKPQGRVVKPLK